MITSKRAMISLRISLGIIFLWFGVLKLFDSSASLRVIEQTLPVLADSQLFVFLFAFSEILIGVSFIVNKLDRIAAIVMVVTLTIITAAVLIISGFDPRFPILSLEGEYALKNLAIIAAGLVLISERENTSKIKSNLTSKS